MNYDGLRDDVVKLLAGEEVYLNTNKFQNDMTTFKSKDDVLTLLIHLGYLGYNSSNQTCYIPNKEVTSSFVASVEDSSWNETTKALLNSRELLEATWNQDEKKVAKYIEEAHLDTSILTYNNENALSYTISIVSVFVTLLSWTLTVMIRTRGSKFSIVYVIALFNTAIETGVMFSKRLSVT